MPKTPQNPNSIHPVGWSPETQWAGIQAGEKLDFVAIYQEQRERAPVAWRSFEDGQGFWCVFNHADVARVLDDPATFSSAKPKYGLTLIPIEVDPPDHRKYRQLLGQLINTARLKRMEDDIRNFVRAELQQLKDGKIDLLTLTAAIPVQSFCQMVSDPNPEGFRALHLAREAANDPRLARFDETSVAKRVAANQPLADYCTRMIAEHRVAPRDDIVSDILAGVVDGRPISDQEAHSMLSLLYIAGSRTTTAALRGSLVQLLRVPHLLERLRADPSLIPAAIEEIVRLESPVHGLPRYATTDVEIAGQKIAKGEQVFPNYGAANVDPAVFQNPGEIDLDRRPVRHVGFGRGIHICAGAPLARMQMRVFLQELTASVSSISSTGEPITRMTWPHYGATALPARLEW